MRENTPMTPRWYISRSRPAAGSSTPEKSAAGAVGPVSAAKLLEMASLGQVGADDFVLMEGADVEITVNDFVAMARGGTLPGTEASTSVKPSASQAAPTNDASLPDWLADVVPGKSILESKIPAALSWLEDIREIEESLRRDAAPTTVGPPMPKVPTAPLPLATLVGPVAPPMAVPVAPIAPPLATPVAPTAPPPLAIPVAQIAPPMPPPAVPAAQLGFDPETGQIFDSVAYAQWHKAEAGRRQEELQKQPPISIAEVFLQAQRAIHEWVDADESKPLVTGGDGETIRNCPSLVEIMRRYDAYGPVMQEKLWKRLFFLVENRKKYFQAIA
jgi:hypothetical protein